MHTSFVYFHKFTHFDKKIFNEDDSNMILNRLTTDSRSTLNFRKKISRAQKNFRLPFTTTNQLIRRATTITQMNNGTIKQYCTRCTLRTNDFCPEAIKKTE